MKLVTVNWLGMEIVVKRAVQTYAIIVFPAALYVAEVNKKIMNKIL